MHFDEWNVAIFLRKNSNNFLLNLVTKNVSFLQNFPFRFNSSHLKFHQLAWFNLSTLLPKNHTNMRFSVKRMPSTEEKEIPGSPSMATNHDTKHMIKYVEIPYTSWTGRRQFSFKNQRSGLR